MNRLSSITQPPEKIGSRGPISTNHQLLHSVFKPPSQRAGIFTALENLKSISLMRFLKNLILAMSDMPASLWLVRLRVGAASCLVLNCLGEGMLAPEEGDVLMTRPWRAWRAAPGGPPSLFVATLWERPGSQYTLYSTLYTVCWL